MTEELKIILEMVNKTTEMGLVAFTTYLVYLLLVTLIKWGLPSYFLFKVVDRVFKNDK